MPVVDRWMRSIRLNVAVVDPNANLLLLHRTPCFKHPFCRPLSHMFLLQAKQSCPAQPASLLPPGRGKTGGVLVLVFDCASQAQDFVQVKELLQEVLCRLTLWSAFQSPKGVSCLPFRSQQWRKKKKLLRSCSFQQQSIGIQDWYIHVPLHRKLAIALQSATAAYALHAQCGVASTIISKIEKAYFN